MELQINGIEVRKFSETDSIKVITKNGINAIFAVR
tara:strand:- start:57582 stop:57686 length:105 start_codon:yes stop_codon:yes gene_type:complete